jgi:TolB-like protein/Flp pilus assembly protein TadD/class 3 adenylate cyclase
MSANKIDLRPEIAHVLFMDVVGYSKLSINEQTELVGKLNEIVRQTNGFRTAEAAGKLVRLPTGDGMALVFFNSPEAPIRCAAEISRALKTEPAISLRMGINSGPVNEVLDVNERSNVAGAGIDIARRVMECGDAGHILVSKRAADDLMPYQQWRAYLQELGETPIKHGERISIFNFYTGDVGNPRIPAKLKERSAPRVTSRTFILAGAAIAFVLLIAIGAFLIRQRSTSSSETSAPEKSIAVLPFDNLSKEEENAFFAGGVQDEILTNLSKIADLKVISRTSVMKYKSGPERNIREIAKFLGVAHVVEGSVQRAGNRVRVSAQLIDARSDAHLWANHYDGDVADVFAVETKMAQEIADQLRAKLSPSEKSRVAQKPTENTEAYLVYLQALGMERHAQSVDDFRKVAALYEKATQLDSSFALAFARLSYMEARLFYERDPLPGRLDRARDAVREALRGQPALPEAHFALGYILLRERDYERALQELNVAAAGLPNNSDAFLLISATERRQGKWPQAISHAEKAASLDPQDGFKWGVLGADYSDIRQFANAVKAADRGCAADPNLMVVHGLRALLDLEWKGDTTAIEQWLSNPTSASDVNGTATLMRFRLKLFQRKYEEARQTIASSSRDTFREWKPTGSIPKSFLVGQAHQFAQNPSEARKAFEEAKWIVQHASTEQPDDAAPHVLLGEIYANLGQKDEALREGKRAVELLPESRDAVEGPLMTLGLARIYTILGDADAAIPLLEHSLSSPAGVHVPILKLDPVWDPLRGDARFEKLVASLKPK